MVMGLFVISAVLTPITTFLHTPLSMGIPAWTEAAPQDMPAIADGEATKLGRNAVQEQYRLILENQIKALALDTQGVKSAAVAIKFADGSGGVVDQPQILGVNVTLTLASASSSSSPSPDISSTSSQASDSDEIYIQPVAPVDIGAEPAAKQPSPTCREVQDKISAFMSLSKDIIHVQEG